MKCPLCTKDLEMIGRCGYCRNNNCSVDRCQTMNGKIITVTGTYK